MIRQTILQTRSTLQQGREKHRRRTKTKKPKWKSGEIETLIDELEKRSCLWDVFDKDYHNREKREVAYTELEDIVKHIKPEILL